MTLEDVINLQVNEMDKAYERLMVYIKDPGHINFNTPMEQSIDLIREWSKKIIQTKAIILESKQLAQKSTP